MQWVSIHILNFWPWLLKLKMPCFQWNQGIQQLSDFENDYGRGIQWCFQNDYKGLTTLTFLGVGLALEKSLSATIRYAFHCISIENQDCSWNPMFQSRTSWRIPGATRKKLPLSTCRSRYCNFVLKQDFSKFQNHQSSFSHFCKTAHSIVRCSEVKVEGLKPNCKHRCISIRWLLVTFAVFSILETMLGRFYSLDIKHASRAMSHNENNRGKKPWSFWNTVENKKIRKLQDLVHIWDFDTSNI